MQQDIKKLRVGIIIPAYNEEKSIKNCLVSLLNQTRKPRKIIVVDDSSTDKTGYIIKALAEKYKSIVYKKHETNKMHIPGSKIINAFKFGLNNENLNDYDIICKYDADLIFPKNYIETIEKSFLKDDKLALSGGVCSVESHGSWIVENITNPDHVRGALKAYRVKAFKSMNGLISQMGWDTADEIKLRYAGWRVLVNSDLHVKQTKPTASLYKKKYFEMQGEVFSALRYDILLLIIASLKIGIKQKSFKGFFKTVISYFKSKNQINYIITKEEGKHYRKYRWQQIFKKLTQKKTTS